MAEDIWDKLYNEARRVQNARVISPFIEADGVSGFIATWRRLVENVQYL